MKQITPIKIYNIVGSGLCVDPEDADKIYGLVLNELKNDKRVNISFENVEVITTAFLNTAIGKLYNDFDEDFIIENIKYSELNPDYNELLSRVQVNAKLYFKNRETFESVIKETLAEV